MEGGPWLRRSITVDERGVARLVLNRPDKHNAMNAAMIAELTEAAGRLGRDPAVRVVVLTGAGASFSAGGDLAWMRAQMEADAATRAREARSLAEMLGALDRDAEAADRAGAGAGLRRRCGADQRVRRGRGGRDREAGPDGGAAGPDPGDDRALRDRADGRGAGAGGVLLGPGLRRGGGGGRWAFWRGVVPAEELDAAVEAEVAPYLAAAPGAVAAGKRLVAELSPPVDEAQVARSIEALVGRWEDPESAEGIAAFFEKRKPGWRE
jgi:methylglutaconyl-CoA hydratase